jgi:hypothetical protein
LRLRDDAAVLAWFEEHFPACLRLVPRQRRGRFLDGVGKAVDDGVADLGD